MATDLLTRESVDDSDAVPVVVDGTRVGSVSRETYLDRLDAPEYVRMEFVDPPTPETDDAEEE